MTIIIETEEDIRRAKLFNDSLNARWKSACSGRSTPALLYFRTREPGEFENILVMWSTETAAIQETALAAFADMTAEDGLHKGVAIGEEYWIGVLDGEMTKFYDLQSEASRIHPLRIDDAIQSIEDAISRIKSNIAPNFPPLADLYFLKARIYHEHGQVENHDAEFETGLKLLLENLDGCPEFYGHKIATKMKSLASLYLYRSDLARALDVYEQLKQIGELVPASVAQEMTHDWHRLAEFYMRHKRYNDAAACCHAMINEINWKAGPAWNQYSNIRYAASMMLELNREEDAEKIYEQFLAFGLSHNLFRKHKGPCFNGPPCGHWFDPYLELLNRQKRLDYRLKVIAQLDLDEREYRPTLTEDLYGYIDRDGNWQIPQRFESAGSFSEGTAEVLLTTDETSHGRARLIDKNGNLLGNVRGFHSRCDNLVPEGYEQDSPLSEGLSVVYKKSVPSGYASNMEPELCGYADADGNLVIEAKYTEAKPFYKGVAIVAVGGYIGAAGCVISLQNGQYGLIDKTGEFLLEPHYRRLWRYNSEECDDLMVYLTEEGGGVVTLSGEVRSYLDGCNDIFHCSEGLASVDWKNANGQTRYGYLDAEGRINIEPQFDNASSFVGDRAVVRVNDKFGFINRKGQIVIDTKYDDALSFKNGVALVTQNDQWGCIDLIGNFILEPQFDRMEWRKDGLIQTNKSGKVGLLSSDGETLCAPQFDEIDQFTEGFAIVTLDELKGAIDTNGQLRIKPIYHELDSFSENLACAAVRDEAGLVRWGFVNGDGETVIHPMFAESGYFSEGLAAMRAFNDDKFGYIGVDGKFEIKPQFDCAGCFYSGRARVGNDTECDGRLYGIIDTTGKYVLAPEYEVVNPVYQEGLCVVGRKRHKKT